MDTPKSLLSAEESGWIVKAFLGNPDRLEKGATEEEIIRVLNWANDLKLRLSIDLGILFELYSGNLNLNTTSDDVVMSRRDDSWGKRETTEVLKYLNTTSLVCWETEHGNETI